jgi:hypothetical protein
MHHTGECNMTRGKYWSTFIRRSEEMKAKKHLRKGKPWDAGTYSHPIHKRIYIDRRKASP